MLKGRTMSSALYIIEGRWKYSKSNMYTALTKCTSHAIDDARKLLQRKRAEHPDHEFRIALYDFVEVYSE